MSVQDLLEAELARFDAGHPRSRSLAEQARASLLAGVPMHWMMRWPGGFPVFAVECLVMFEFVGTIRRVISKRRENAWPAVAPES